MNNLKRGELDLSEAARIPDTSCNQKVALSAGDLVWGMSGSTGETGSLENYARVREQDLPGQLNQRVGRFVVSHAAIDLNYLEYAIQTPYFYEQVMLEVTGTAQFNVSSEQVQSCVVCFPPNTEQTAIAAFLDRETGKIDELVAEQRRLIELLKEKRQAVISHAVTKGLNPDAPTKPSGIEWLGDVPEHWETVTLKGLFAIKHGYAFDGSRFSDTGEYTLMTPGSFHETGGFRERDSEKYYTANDVLPEFILKKGQLVVAMTEQAPGLLGIALFVPADATYLHNQRIGRIHSVRSDKIDQQYLFHLFNSDRIRAHVFVTSNWLEGQTHFTPENIEHSNCFATSFRTRTDRQFCRHRNGQARHPHRRSPTRNRAAAGTPHRSDLLRRHRQDRCEKYLTRSRGERGENKMTHLIPSAPSRLRVNNRNEAQRGIELLQERRTALISSAVTGKIDVRNISRGDAVNAEKTK